MWSIRLIYASFDLLHLFFYILFGIVFKVVFVYFATIFMFLEFLNGVCLLILIFFRFISIFFFCILKNQVSMNFFQWVDNNLCVEIFIKQSFQYTHRLFFFFCSITLNSLVSNSVLCFWRISYLRDPYIRVVSLWLSFVFR